MAYDLTEVGAADERLHGEVHLWWRETASNQDIDVSLVCPQAMLEERIAGAITLGLDIGTIYSRFSSKRQHSTSDQVRTCVQHAATKGIYCPPEFVCVDEGQHGYRTRRDGLDRMLGILKKRYATVLLVFKASRLYRQAFKGYQLIQQEVVEEGLRAISVTQGIDTADTKAWRMLFQVHGMVDDMVIEATSDHVRAGLKGLFARGYAVGALPVGYRPKELPDAPVTNRGRTRTQPEVDPDAAEMIMEHFKMINDGASIRHGWQKWVADLGPTDPRSPSKRMSYPAYRRMLSRVAYTGRWEFGRKRNEFSTKLDYARQVEQSDNAVEVYQCEELRIVDDELFFAVQRRLSRLTTGPRGPKTVKPHKLWDLVTGCFWCPACDVRYYQTGANGKGMQCKNGALCPSTSTVRREYAVRAICDELCRLMHQDEELIAQIVGRALEVQSLGDNRGSAQADALQRKVSSLSNRINDLCEMVGHGSDQDRKEMKQKIRAVQLDRTSAQLELSRLQLATENASASITPESITAILSELTSLLTDAAAGKLGEDSVHRASAVFEDLIGGRIWVHVKPRPNRKQSNVVGVFQPAIIGAVFGHSDSQFPHPAAPHSGVVAENVEVWLRKPPRLDAIAQRVHELMDVQGFSYRDTAKQLQSEGHNVNSGNVWYSYRRWYEMRGLPTPKRLYNNGQRRRPK